VATLCNLDCDYCYVYRGPDQSWRRKPKIMSPQIVEKAVSRIAEHVSEHKLSSISVVAHGGEPLLAGIDFVECFFRVARERIPCQVDLGMQSNLTLLTPKVAEIFHQFGATIGVSLDGPRAINDRHRKDTCGSSSFDRVLAGLKILTDSKRAQGVFSGILAVIDVESDPVEVYDFLRDFGPRTIDFLLPDATHDAYPPGKGAFEHTPYADWLIRLFDHWWQDKKQVPIRLLDNIVALLLGGSCDTEYLGLQSVDLIVIESDGSLEAVDTLKVAYDGAPVLNLNIFESSFDDAIRHPFILSRMLGAESRSNRCQACPLLHVCGGGYLPHRYSSAQRFANPSVYCHDLAKLILHIRHAIKDSVSIAAERETIRDNGFCTN
jgi:uncharacterized protein